MYKLVFKRLLDIVLSLLALIALFVPLLVIALLVRLKIGSPVLFKQKRSGRNGKPFMLLKFRSMTEDRDEKGVYLPDEKRVTPFGSFIRKTSIDELPSLLNILKGDMSIIGPRPLPVRYLDRYTDEQKRRLEARPGLSNVAVTNGRNTQSWDEQFEKDVWYVPRFLCRRREKRHRHDKNRFKRRRLCCGRRWFKM